jgi:hypothetical protein
MITQRLLVLALSGLLVGAGGGSKKKEQERDDRDTGIVRAEGCVFKIKTPRGWIRDDVSGEPLGMQVVFYKDDSSWTRAMAVLSARVLHKGIPETAFVAKIVEGDLSRFRKKHAAVEVKVEEERPLKTRDGRKTLVKHFIGDPLGDHEAAAYIQEGRKVVVLGLTARNREEFKEALPVFEDLVESYRRIEDEGEAERDAGP